MIKKISNIIFLGKPLKATCIVMLMCFFSSSMRAQVDPHFSQYYVYPAWLNPALTGAIDGDYRVSGIYRSQWGNVSSPFSTPGISADVVTNKNMNFGAGIMNQTAGGGGYNYLNGYLSMAYTGLRFGKNGTQQISLGYSVGIINRRFNPSKFQYGDQWNSVTGYSASNPGSESLSNSSATTFDIGAGAVYYDAAPGKKANLFLGFSANHLTQPEDPFISSGTNTKLPIRYTAHGGVRLRLSETVSLIPNLLYMRQGDAEEKMAGAYAQFRANETTNVLLGANYRVDDAVVPFAGIGFKNYVIGASYDINTSDLGNLVKSASSFEISFSYTGRKKNSTKEPVEFICPRL